MREVQEVRDTKKRVRGRRNKMRFERRCLERAGGGMGRTRGRESIRRENLLEMKVKRKEMRKSKERESEGKWKGQSESWERARLRDTGKMEGGKEGRF